jgi:hypothetical protein
LIPAAVVFGVGGAIYAYAAWRANRPADPLKPRLLPWRTISVFAGATAFLALVALLLTFAG